MEKHIRKFPIDYPLGWIYGVSIKQIKEDVEKLEALGATHINIDMDYDSDKPRHTIEAYSERLETDEEFHERIQQIIKHKEAIRVREMELLKGLKLKYEGVCEK